MRIIRILRFITLSVSVSLSLSVLLLHVVTLRQGRDEQSNNRFCLYGNHELEPSVSHVGHSSQCIQLKNACKNGSTTTRLRTFRLRHFVYRLFVYRHFVYYCIPASSTVMYPTSVSENHYFHQFQLLFTP